MINDHVLIMDWNPRLDVVHDSSRFSGRYVIGYGSIEPEIMCASVFPPTCVDTLCFELRLPEMPIQTSPASPCGDLFVYVRYSIIYGMMAVGVSSIAERSQQPYKVLLTTQVSCHWMPMLLGLDLLVAMILAHASEVRCATIIS